MGYNHSGKIIISLKWVNSYHMSYNKSMFFEAEKAQENAAQEVEEAKKRKQLAEALI